MSLAAPRLLSSARLCQTSTSLFGRLAVQTRTKKTTVRVICLQDLPNGKAYKNDIVHVRPGYARNYLIPKKYVLYATHENFKRVGLHDPDQESERERQQRLAREAANESDQDLKAADILKKYLAGKTLTIWRQVAADSDRVPLDRMGVIPRIIKNKLNKQLKISLEPHERVYIRDELVESFDELYDPESAEKLDETLKEMGPYEAESPEVKVLGNYLVRIWLRGDHLVPLKLNLARKP